MELGLHNTFIFNWVEGYDQKIEMLKNTFEDSKLNNRVEIFNNISYNELVDIVNRLRLMNFDLFNYVTVIILENKSKHEQLIKTRDNVNVLLYSEILTLLKTNKSLGAIPHLFVVQKLADFDVVNSCDDYVITRSKSVHSDPIYKSRRIYESLEYTISAKEWTDNFRESPFIAVLCRVFLANLTQMSMPDITFHIRHEIKKNYKIEIELGRNDGKHEVGVLGVAVDPAEFKDFLKQ